MNRPPLTPESYATDLAARFPAPFVERIEEGRVRDYLLALDQPPLAAGEPVPPLFLLTLARQRRPHLVNNSSGTGGVNAGDSFEFFAPIFVGDRLTVTSTVLGIEPKQAASRDMLLARIEYVYVNQHGRRVARRVNTTIRW